MAVIEKWSNGDLEMKIVKEKRLLLRLIEGEWCCDTVYRDLVDGGVVSVDYYDALKNSDEYELVDRYQMSDDLIESILDEK